MLRLYNHPTYHSTVSDEVVTKTKQLSALQPPSFGFSTLNSTPVLLQNNIATKPMKQEQYPSKLSTSRYFLCGLTSYQ